MSCVMLQLVQKFRRTIVQQLIQVVSALQWGELLSIST